MRLAVLIPVFNAGPDLQRTLDSLVADAHPFDIVIVDDGSEPPVTVPGEIGGHRIVLLRHDDNRGVAHALNTGVAWITAREYDLIARLDAGDMNEPGRLPTQADFLEANGHVAMVGSWTRHVDERMEPLFTTRYPTRHDAICRCLHFRTAFSHPACMIRTSVLRDTGCYDPRFTLAEDYELFWRVAARYPCANIPQVLVTRVESRRSLTHARRLESAIMRLRVQWAYFNARRLDSWLGVARSIGLLFVPVRVALALKRAAGLVS